MSPRDLTKTFSRATVAIGITVVALVGLSICLAAEASADHGEAEIRGKQVFDHWCVACHGHGAARPGTDAMRRNGFNPPYLTERSDIAPALTRQVVRHGILFMPWFRKTEISDAQLEDLAAYLATAYQHAANNDTPKHP
jgi:(+)-pinoresinol hydroxylase